MHAKHRVVKDGEASEHPRPAFQMALLRLNRQPGKTRAAHHAQEHIVGYGLKGARAHTEARAWGVQADIIRGELSPRQQPDGPSSRILLMDTEPDKTSHSISGVIKPGHEKGPENGGLDFGSSGRVRTYDLVVNSHPLYR